MQSNYIGVGKILEEPSILMFPSPDVSKPQKEPEQNPETSTEKVQNPNLENTAHVPSPGEEDSIFIEIPKPKAKKTVNLDPNPNSYPSKLPYPERMKVREHDKPSAQYSSRNLENVLRLLRFRRLELKDSLSEMQKARMLVVESIFTSLRILWWIFLNPDPESANYSRRPFPSNRKLSYDLYEEKLTLRVGKDELVYYADKSEKNKDKNCVHAISIIDFSKEDPFSGSTTNSLHPSSSPVKTSDNIEKFTDELAPLDSLTIGNDDSTLKKEFYHRSKFSSLPQILYSNSMKFQSSNGIRS
ncbi:hypothetical protein Tco_0272094 [Tanacetum coccineum]